MSKHTPGPWSAVRYPSKTWSVETDKATVADRVTEPEDARLIAAAPDLLTELKWALDRLENWAANASGGDDAKMERSFRFLDRIRAAIAKAEGNP